MSTLKCIYTKVNVGLSDSYVLSTYSTDFFQVFTNGQGVEQQRFMSIVRRFLLLGS